jgi:hypothetical protein
LRTKDESLRPRVEELARRIRAIDDTFNFHIDT